MSQACLQQLGAAGSGLLPLVSRHPQVPWHLCALWTANLSEQRFDGSPQQEQCANSSGRAETPPTSLL